MSFDNAIDLIRSIETSKHYKLCPNRIWHVWQASYSQPKEDGSTPKMEDLLQSYAPKLESALTHEDHSACSVDFCEFSSRNFTAIKQYHEPRRHEEGDQLQVAEQHEAGQTCLPLQELFSDRKLCDAVDARKLTPWNLDGSAILEHPRPYMAISHVWSDGTGAGTWGPKQVNECLYRYFQGIAIRFRCQGLWWDTLCVPLDRRARSKALDTMASNYEFAKLTLVHDRFLRSLDFEDPERALLAIAMSPWFTRGWTALELAKSRIVKVIFRNSIKDLDRDILAPCPDSEHRNAESKHPIARFIRVLRNKEVLHIKDLLLVLKARYTSWLKDRAAIAGLLAGVAIPNSDRDTFQRDTYQRIVKSAQLICHSHLFHKSITMEGEFSWCATSLFDLPHAREKAMIKVNPDGSIYGKWRIFPISITEGSPSRNAYGVHVDLRRREAAERQDEEEELTGDENKVRQREQKQVQEQEQEERNSRLLCSLGNSHGLVEVKLQQVMRRLERNHRDHKSYVILFKSVKDEEDNKRKEAKKEEENEDKKNAVLVKAFTAKDGNGFKCQFLGCLEFVDRPLFLDSDLQLHLTIGDVTNCKELEEDAWEALSCAGHEKKRENARYTADQRSDQAAKRPPSPSERRQRHGEGQEKVKKELSGPEEPPHKLDWSDSHVRAWLRKGPPDRMSLEGLQERDCLKQLPLHLAAERGVRQGDLEPWLPTPQHPDRIKVDYLDMNGQSPLHRAAWGGSAENVSFLLGRGADPAIKDKNGNTVLHVASEMGFTEVVKKLLPTEDSESPVRANNDATSLRYAAARAETDDGFTPLHYAAIRGHYDVAKAILRKAVNIDAEAYPMAWTPLHLAADNGHASVVELLLRHGAKADAADAELKWTPLHFAAMSGHRPVVDRLLERGVSMRTKDENGWTPLDLAAVNGHRLVVETLLRDSRATTEDSLAQFWKSEAAGNHEAVVDWIKTNHDKFDHRLGHWLYLAALNGYTTVTELTMNTGWSWSDANEGGRAQRSGQYQLVHDAAEYGLNGTLSFLVGTGHDVSALTTDRTQRTPLHLACSNGHTMTVQRLLSLNASVDELDSEQWTPLHCAAHRGHSTVVQLLCQNGAKCHVPAANGRIALHLAAQSGHREIVEFLIRRKSEVQKKDSNGQTPLHLAAESGHESVVKLLVHRGADKTTKDDLGRSPLWLATIKRRETTMEWLNASHDAQVRDGAGRTPLHVAAENGQVSLLQWLVDKGYGLNRLRRRDTDIYARQSRIKATDIGGRTALHYAAANGKLHVIDWLVRDKAPVLAADNEGRTPLHCGAEHGQKEIIDSLLKAQGQDNHAQEMLLNAIDMQGQTPLHYAVRNGHEEFVQHLLGKKADWRAKDNVGRIALHYAVSNGNDTIFENLYSRLDKSERDPKKIADPNRADSNCRTLLHLAAESDNQMIVERLLTNDANHTARDCHGWTPFLYAATAGRSSSKSIMARILQHHPACINDQDEVGRTALHHAALIGHEEAVKWLLNKASSTSSSTGSPKMDASASRASKLPANEEDKLKQTPLHCAAINGHVKVAECLLDSQALVGKQDQSCWTPLHYAAEGGHYGVLRLLIEKGADVNAKDTCGWTPLHFAAMKQHGACVKWLFSKRADIDCASNSGQTSLHYAAERGCRPIVNILIDNRASIAALDRSGRAPLHCAAENGHLHVVEQLVGKGANVQAQDNYGRTPMHHASKHNRVAIVKWLSKNNATIEAQDNQGQTPLSWAAENGSEAVVEELLNQGAAVEQGVKLCKERPLHFAAKNGHAAIVRHLLDKRAEIQARDHYGQTALHHASIHGQAAVVDLLLERDMNLVGKEADNGQIALHCAAAGGHLKAVQSLLGSNLLGGLHGVRSDLIDATDNNGATPLHCAAKKDQLEVVDWLLREVRAKVDLGDADEDRPLHYAASEGHVRIINSLCRGNATIDAKNKFGLTPLHRAAEGGHVNAIDALQNTLRSKGPRSEAAPPGITVNDLGNRTPLHYAAANDHVKAMARLIGGDVGVDGIKKITDSEGMTPLHYAAIHGKTNAMEWLLARFPDREATLLLPDRSARTPLHFAAAGGHQAVVSLLIEKGARLNTSEETRTKERNPLDAAVASGESRVVTAFIAGVGQNKFVEAATRSENNSTRLAVVKAIGKQVAVYPGADKFMSDILAGKDEDMFLETLGALYGAKDLPDRVQGAIINLCDDERPWRIPRLALMVFQCHKKLTKVDHLLKVVSCLKSFREEIKDAAISVLQCQEELHHEVVTNLVNLVVPIEHKPSHIRVAAAKALRRSSELPVDALDNLVTCLKGEFSSELSTAVAETLRKQASLPDKILKKIEAQISRASEPQMAIRALQNKKKDLAESTLDKISDCCSEKEEIRKVALEIFKTQTKLSQKSIDAVVNCLEDSDVEIRKSAVSVLQKQQTLKTKTLKSIKTHLKGIGKSDNLGKQVSSLEALRGRLDFSQVSDIKEILEERDDQATIAFMEAFHFTSPLSEELSEELMTILLPYLSHKSGNVRISAIRAASNAYEGQTSVPDGMKQAFESCLTADDRRVRWAVIPPLLRYCVLGPHSDRRMEFLSATVVGTIQALRSDKVSKPLRALLTCFGRFKPRLDQDLETIGRNRSSTRLLRQQRFYQSSWNSLFFDDLSTRDAQVDGKGSFDLCASSELLDRLCDCLADAIALRRVEFDIDEDEIPDVLKSCPLPRQLQEALVDSLFHCSKTEVAASSSRVSIKILKLQKEELAFGLILNIKSWLNHKGDKDKDGTKRKIAMLILEESPMLKNYEGLYLKDLFDDEKFKDTTQAFVDELKLA